MEMEVVMYDKLTVGCCVDIQLNPIAANQRVIHTKAERLK